MNTNFYQLKKEYSEALEELFESEHALEEEVVRDRLKYINDDIQTKAKNVAAYYQDVGLKIAQMKEYENRMKVRRQKLESQRKTLRKYLLDGMQHCGINKIDCPEFTISLRRTPDSVIIDDIDTIPLEYIKDFGMQADKAAIKKFIKEGGHMPGAHLESSQTVSVK